MVRFGIIGAGVIAHKFAEAVNMVEGCEVAAIASRDGECAKVFATKWGIANYFGSYEDLLVSGVCDIIYLATTNQTHKDLALMTLNHNHHLLCEKPLALNYDDAHQIFSLAKKRDLFAMEAMWSRFLPTLVTVRSWIKEGLIGAVHIANMMVSLDAPPDHRVRNKETGGGILYDLGVYPLQILPFLLDEQVKDLRAIVKRDENGVDVADSLILDFGTCLASVHCSMNVGMAAPTVLCGEKGYIHIYVGHKAKRAEAYDLEGSLIKVFEDNYTNGFEHQVAHVVECLNEGKTESSVVDHRTSLLCAKIFDQVLG